jgi:hypothetical protein
MMPAYRFPKAQFRVEWVTCPVGLGKDRRFGIDPSLFIPHNDDRSAPVRPTIPEVIELPNAAWQLEHLLRADRIKLTQ